MKIFIIRSDNMISDEQYYDLKLRVGELENKTSALETRMDLVEDYQRNVASALAKLKKRTFFASDIVERNWMIYCAATYLKWDFRVIAKKFNLTTQQIGNIVNSMCTQYGY
jgi:hypothetical protein